MPRPFAFLAAALLALGTLGPQLARADDVPSLVVKDVVVGTGSTARDDSDVRIQYTGWLYSAKAPDHHGTEIDSSYDSGRPLTFTMGANEVIEGMESGVRGMKVGGKRTVIIPSRMGYGFRGAAPDVPANSALVFDIELLDVH
ncbi:FKBP-type peptidyl-prolyl cis-trans isomerase [Dyella nitratireducens]|uniref:Peptidyl-prolyl cis-trans isomerase n=1 Tax=Dyella nitratireducens TaxID=1849580 RepID=A0ABQ1GKT7_9GAMM|nr:FKBP-type peptidyl-prolyl cis-trans isomerase [Dyella nitratireducens]GGA45382.1 peptidyl-prolyl cis-trans isomerase [Dyella nitratireducens]GLQ41311.1 peptidyl-prolyl cis-trans isomerase [Dyella nitratireducens]